MSTLTESVVEDAALAWLEALGYAVLHGSGIAVGMLGADDLWRYAKINRVTNVMRPHLEAVA